MRLTREEFIELWQDRLAGMALRGLVLDTDERKGPIVSGRMAMELPEKIAKLAGMMFDSLKPKEEPKPLPSPATNGAATARR